MGSLARGKAEKHGALQRRADHAPAVVSPPLLECGVLAHGFARVRCERCKDELLVAFSSDVLTVFLRAVFALQRRRARRQGIRHGQVGAVSFIQFFGSALQVTPHFHSLVPDGVFLPGEDGLRFEALPPSHASAPPCQRRQGLERLCRDGARGALALERLSRMEDGRLAYRMTHPLPDGTTLLFFTGLDLLRRLASLGPPPRTNLTRFHGIFAPGAKVRPFLLPQAGGGAGAGGGEPGLNQSSRFSISQAL
ncbi:transposase [Myxococcus virescens]|uniref:Transposase n=1 Tax=Myxococcus virescens TaxID=83456 RepID=A0A511HGD1_9BACT|nr:transposase [Myxococcus virescens]GEL72608.1 hypothetical protein MVI01_43920 [Myxococcus virescens]SDF10610.1 Putative transposase [Myxococcus virescens]